MRNHFNLHREPPGQTPPSPGQARSGKWNVPVVVLLLLLLLGGGIWGGWSFATGGFGKAERPVEDALSRPEPPGLSGNGDPGPDPVLPDSGNEGDWWDPGQKVPGGDNRRDPATDRRAAESPSVRGNTRDILHNNWRNPDLNRKPDPPEQQPELPHPKIPRRPDDAARPPAPPRPSPGPMQLSVWYPWWGDESARSALRSQSHRIDELNFLGPALTPDGTVRLRKGTGPLDTEAHRLARKEGIRVIPVLDSGYSAAMLHGLISDPAKRGKTIRSIRDWVSDGGYNGVELQFQPMSEEDRDAYSLFVEELSRELHKGNFRLNVAVHPKTSEPGRYPAQRAQDWKRIGQAADSVKIMAWNYSWGEPGPAAPLPWIEDVLTFAGERISPAKITLGLSAHGHYWPAEGTQYALLHAQLRRWKEAGARPVKRPQDGEPCFVIHRGKTRVTGCVPDGAGMAAKLRSVKESHPKIGGWSLWYLGAEDPGLWEALEKDAEPVPDASKAVAGKRRPR